MAHCWSVEWCHHLSGEELWTHRSSQTLGEILRCSLYSLLQCINNSLLAPCDLKGWCLNWILKIQFFWTAHEQNLMVNPNLKWTKIICWPPKLPESWFSFYSSEKSQLLPSGMHSATGNRSLMSRVPTNWSFFSHVIRRLVSNDCWQYSSVAWPYCQELRHGAHFHSGWILSLSTLFNTSTEVQLYVKVISETGEVKKN